MTRGGKTKGITTEEMDVVEGVVEGKRLGFN